MRITKANVGKLALPEGKADFVHFDESLPGFGLRIRSSGKRTWYVHKRTKEGVLKRTIGDVALLDLEDARIEARKLLNKAERSALLDERELREAAERRRREDEERARDAITLDHVVKLYIAQHVEPHQKSRTQLETKRHLSSHWEPLHQRPLHKILRRDVAGRLNEIARKCGPITANRARSALTHLFSWAMRQGLAEENPVIGTSKPGREVSRDRVLKPAELRAIWQATEADGDYNAILRLLLLTGQRREEVAAMRWSEIDLDKALWTLPPARTKNGLPHDVPLSEQALAIIAQRRRRRDAALQSKHRDAVGQSRDLIFGEGAGPFSGWSQCKARLDDRIAKSTGKALEQAAEVVSAPVADPWRVHDLRRTVVTGMAEELAILPHVIEAVVNHVSGHKSGVAGIYNRATYAAEKRQALAVWAAHVAAIVAGTAAKIVPLRPTAHFKEAAS